MKIKVRKIVMAGLLGALAIALGLTPLGFIPVPTPALHATTMHIPAIIAGILEGPLVGAMVGLIFGLFSFFQATIPIFRDPLIAILPRMSIGIFAFYAFSLTKSKYIRPLVSGAMGITLGHTTFYTTQLLEKNFPPGSAWWYKPLQFLAHHPERTIPLSVIIGLGAAILTYWLFRKAGAPAAFSALIGTLTNTVGVLSLAVVRGYLPPVAAISVGILHGLPEILVAIIVVVLVERSMARIRQKG